MVRQPGTRLLLRTCIATLLSLLTCGVFAQAERRQIATGTAFVVDPSGYLFTCAHVVRDQEYREFEVMLGGKSYAATVVGKNDGCDVALLHIEATGLTPLPLADSSRVKTGEEVSAFGFPLIPVLGEGLKITKGGIAGINQGALLLDVLLNPGNSGGPLVNTRGEVVGIVFGGKRRAIETDETDKGLGLAMPINQAMPLLRDHHTNLPRSSAYEALDGPTLFNRVSPSVALVRVYVRPGGAIPFLKPLASLTGHQYEVVAVCFSPDGTILASTGYDRTLKLWDPRTRQLKNSWSTGPDKLNSIAFSPEGKTLVGGGQSGRIMRWEASTGDLKPAIGADMQMIRSVAFSPDGRFLLAGSLSAYSHLWAAETGEHILRLPGMAGAVAFSPDGKTIACGAFSQGVVLEPGQLCGVQLWDATTGAPKAQLHLGANVRMNVRSVAFSPDGMTLACASGRGCVLFDTQTGAPKLSSVMEHEGIVTSVAFSPDGNGLATGSLDGIVRLWNTGTCGLMRLGMGHGGGVECVAFSPDGKMLASAGKDTAVTLWEAEGLSASVRPVHSSIYQIAPDGRYFNLTHRFSIAPPSGWRPDYSGQYGVVAFVSPATQVSGACGTICIVCKNSPVSLTEYVAEFKESAAATLEGFKLIREMRRTVDQRKAYEVLFAFNQSMQDRTYRWQNLKIFVATADTKYEIIGGALEEHYPQFGYTFSNTAESFKIEGGP